MSLIQKTNAEKIAQEIDSINTEAISFIKAMMSNAFAKANTAGEQQAIMDVFGTNAVNALTVYSTFHAALSALGQADGLAAPDFNQFTPQPDGKVIFTAPAQPEPQSELEPEPESI
jgi:hypothetical protein